MADKYIIRQGKDGLQIYGNNLQFLKCKSPEIVLSGPADTGKTFALCLKVHLCACKYPGAVIVFVRKTQSSCYNTVLRTFTGILGPDVDQWPCTPYGGLNKTERFNYDNGSVIFVAGLDKPSRLMSGEFDLVAGSQVEEFSLVDWEIMATRTTGRAGHIPYNQIIGDCNPANPSHWIKQRQKAGTLTLFESSHRDNPDLFDQTTGLITEQGKTRIGALDRLTGVRKLRLRKGIWAAPEGAIYDVFDEDRHKVASFPIPQHWPRAVGIDPAGQYRAAVWLAWDPDNQILNVYQELLEPFGTTVQRFVNKVIEQTANAPVFAWVCGAKAERDWRTEFEAAGLPVTEPPIADVWIGIDRVYELLQDFKLVVHDCCGNLLSEIGEYSRKENKRTGEFTDAIENKEKYHTLDALRYITVWLATPTEGLAQVNYSPVRVGRW